ncbi:MAG: 3-hydroxy-5-phosphonooxypentane-2,4-dione thiolase [Coriobacteriia bacterium]
MSWGLENRLSRIIQPQDGRTVMLAVDHGYFLGPTSGLESIRESIVPLAPYADTLMLTRGILRSDIPTSLDTPVVLRVSGGNSVLDDDLSNETIITDIDEVIRLNAAGMALSIFVGSAYQHQTIANLAKLVDLGERYGIPVIAVTAVGKEMVRDARYLALATRIAAEMGAHIVKTYYVEDDFERITSTCSVPVVMAGGKKLPEREALQMTYNAIARGASGVDMGRNIFQSDSPLGMIKAVNAVVHGNASVDDAYAVYEDEKSASGKSAAAGVSADDARKI